MRCPVTEHQVSHARRDFSREAAPTGSLGPNEDPPLLDQLSSLTLGINVNVKGTTPKNCIFTSLKDWSKGCPRDHSHWLQWLSNGDHHHSQSATSINRGNPQSNNSPANSDNAGSGLHCLYRDHDRRPTPKASERQTIKTSPEIRRDEGILSREARPFWTWSAEFQNWCHIDNETGSLTWAPLDFD